MTNHELKVADEGSLASNSTKVPNVELWWSPDAVVVNGNEIFVFHAAADKSNKLYLKVYTPSTGWQTDIAPNSMLLSHSPSVVAYRGALYIFHQGSGNTNTGNQLWYSVRYSQNNWVPERQITGVSMNDSPNAIVYNDRIRVFYQGTDDNSLRYIDLTD